MNSPRRLYRVLALAEVVTWTLLILGMLGKYVLDLGPMGVRIGGGLHGFVFLSYCVVTVLVGVDTRWGLGRILLGLGSALVPYLTLPFERSVERKGLLADRWRLRRTADGGDAPQRPTESIAAVYVHHPVVAGLVTLVGLVAVFSGLLTLGPPTQWFS